MITLASPKTSPKTSPKITPMNKSKKSDEFESPVMKRSYSDYITSRSTRRIARTDSNDSPGWDDFEMIRFLGKGAYGVVWLVKKKATGDYYAMKMVAFDDISFNNRLNSLKAEKDIYQQLEGDFVVKAIWTFQHDNLICFVTEFMVGGDFNKMLDKVARFDEDQARFYFAELVLAVESLHKLNVVHRDLKPDNILMDKKGHIRLTDFGLSQSGFDRLKGSGTPTRKNSKSPNSNSIVNKLVKTASGGVVTPKDNKCENKQNGQPKKCDIIFSVADSDNLQIIPQKKPIFMKKCKEAPEENSGKPKMVGTPDYMAPEIINPDKYNIENYDERSIDWWAMGAILYQFLVGIPPFCDCSIEKVFDNIRNLRMDWPDIGIIFLIYDTYFNR